MTLNRFITSLIQLALLGVTLPLAYAVVMDIKENGLLSDPSDKIETTTKEKDRK